MAYDSKLHEEARRLQKEEGMSIRAIARTLGGISPATVKAWLDEVPNPEAGPVGIDEEEVTELLLKKARTLLVGLENWSESKEQLEVASAVDKLLGKYLSLTGTPDEKHVSVDSPELTAWASNLVKSATKA